MNNNNFILYISPFTSNLTYHFRIASHIAKFSERKIVRLLVYLIPSLLARKEGPITRLSRSSCFERIRSTGGLGRWWNSLECTHIYIFFFSPGVGRFRTALQFSSKSETSETETILISMQDFGRKRKMHIRQRSGVHHRLPAFAELPILLFLPSPRLLSFPPSGSDIGTESIAVL